MFAAFALGNAAPSLGSFATSRGAAYTLWEIIDTVRDSLLLQHSVRVLCFMPGALMRA